MSKKTTGFSSHPALHDCGCGDDGGRPRGWCGLCPRGRRLLLRVAQLPVDKLASGNVEGQGLLGRGANLARLENKFERKISMVTGDVIVYVLKIS